MDVEAQAILPVEISIVEPLRLSVLSSFIAIIIYGFNAEDLKTSFWLLDTEIDNNDIAVQMSRL